MRLSFGEHHGRHQTTVSEWVGLRYADIVDPARRQALIK